MLPCSKNCKIDDLANHWPTIGKTGPTHQPVTTPMVAATITSGIKYPANDIETNFCLKCLWILNNEHIQAISALST